MKVFLDANILVSVLNKEYPLFTYTSRILSLASDRKYKIYTSPVCLAIAFYFAEKQSNAKIAKQKISVLCNKIQIAETTKQVVLQSLSNVSINDFEDGLEYYSAKESKCDCIVTEDIGDCHFSNIEVLCSCDFFLKYMSKR